MKVDKSPGKEKSVSLNPLSFDQAIHGLLATKSPPKKKNGKKKRNKK